MTRNRPIAINGVEPGYTPTGPDIVITAGVRIRPYGFVDDRRFAETFRKAWSRMPRGRRELVAYWRRRRTSRPTFLTPPHEPLSTEALDAVRKDLRRAVRRGLVRLQRYFDFAESPVVEVLPRWSGSDAPPAFAMVRAEGCLIQFNANAIRHAPDAVVRDLILHELGHVCIAATDGWQPRNDAEEDMNRAESWLLGCDENRINIWSAVALSSGMDEPFRWRRVQDIEADMRDARAALRQLDPDGRRQWTGAEARAALRAYRRRREAPGALR